MEDIEVTATFRPAPADWTALSKTCRGTIEALYQHPLSHNVEWSDVVALFEKLGTVDRKSHHEIAFGISGEHHRVHKPHNKDLSAMEVMTFRHMLSRAGWAPQFPAPKTSSAPSDRTAADYPERTDLLVVVDHHEARLYQLDVQSADPVDHVIEPHDPHHLLHHLSHKDDARGPRPRAAEDHAFYESIALAVAPARAIVLIGHGKGHSNAAQHLTEYLHRRHPDTFHKVAFEVVADLSSLTAPQLLGLGRRALTTGTSPSAIERPTA